MTTLEVESTRSYEQEPQPKPNTETTLHRHKRNEDASREIFKHLQDTPEPPFAD